MSNLRKGFAIERMLLFHPRLLLEGIHYLQFVSLFRNFLSIHKHKCELFFLKKKKRQESHCSHGFALDSFPLSCVSGGSLCCRPHWETAFFKRYGELETLCNLPSSQWKMFRLFPICYYQPVKIFRIYRWVLTHWSGTLLVLKTFTLIPPLWSYL